MDFRLERVVNTVFLRAARQGHEEIFGLPYDKGADANTKLLSNII